MNRSFVLLTYLGAMSLAACGDDPVEPAPQTLQLAFTGLDPLANGYHYEGWVIIAGTPVATGKFNVGSGGALMTLAGAPIANGSFATGVDLSESSQVVITIEPNGDTDAVPASTHVLAGPVSGLLANLTTGDMAALGSDFQTASGNYVLATPTDGAMNNENSGIWFLSLATGSPAVGLQLPALPSGWVYEGWAVIGGVPVTTGRFTNPAAADMAAPFSGLMAGPPFPGEDYITNAPAGLTFPTNLAGGTAVISIEPQPDDSPAPFTLKPLAGPIAAGALDHVTYSVPNAAAAFPTGTAVIR